MWQTLETKARFIQQVMSGATSVRSAEDLEGGALTYAEIKSIASGNPAVMEKVKVDTEIRKLDQLRAVHLNQQHTIRWQLRTLPQQIAEGQQTLRHLHEDLATRDANTGDSFTMSVGRRIFSGKNARENAATALAEAALSSPYHGALQAHARFRGYLGERLHQWDSLEVMADAAQDWRCDRRARHRHQDRGVALGRKSS